MRIQQSIAALMVLLSLSAQARTVFACGMMPGAALAHCCCPADGKGPCPAGATTACCDQVAPSDAPFAHAVATVYGKHHTPLSPLDLPPVVAPLAHFLPAAFDSGGHDSASPQLAAGRLRVRPLYLQTARLRL